VKTKTSLLALLALAFPLPVATLLIAQQVAGERPVSPSRPEGPCDIYAARGFPCVAAHSTTRALSASYNGPLYQVMRQADGRTLDIGVVQPSGSDPGGYADAAAQDAFCARTVCWITILYDQSGKGNHLLQAPPGTFKGPAKGGFNTLPIADMAPMTISGHKAYGVYIMPGMGLRNNHAAGLAIDDEPQGVYMVFDGTHYSSGCCFNYGNTSTSSRAVGRGTMDTVYFGTATAWGRGSGPGPWIMSDMEAGLFSGYNAGVNEGSPTIDSGRFVTGMVNGGGGNQWEIRGGNAQEGELATFYKGVRPGSRENNFYYPMHRKGAVQMGNGGDNGNGSAGTFYEGVMTSGYPTDAAIHAVQTNIVAAGYDVHPVRLSRVTTFTPASSQEATVMFTNISGSPATGVRLSLSGPAGWTTVAAGTTETTMTFTEPVAPGATVSASFRVTAPRTTGAGYLAGKAEWIGQAADDPQSETTAQRVRNVFPVKINEVRLGTGANTTDQFIELYNASNTEVDLSDWTLVHTPSEWAPLKLATIPAGTKLAAEGFFLLGLSGSGLAAPASAGETTIHVRSTTGFAVGRTIAIGGETRTVTGVGTAAAPMTTVFVPVSTGPWLTFPAGSTNLPVTSATAFEVGQKIGIDLGGNDEIATVTAVGKAATQTTLSEAAAAGAIRIKVAANDQITVGDTLTVDTGERTELVHVKRIVTKVAAPARGGFGQAASAAGGGGELELAAPLRFDHRVDVDVSGAGTGISFLPPTQFLHRSGDAVQALGSGIALDAGLDGNHAYGAAVLNPLATTAGYQGPPAPDQWFGDALSTRAGSIALMDASGAVVVDAMVYGSRQSSSSANGTITSPEIATLEGDQSQGGCIVVAPNAGGGGFGRQGGPAAGDTNQSVGRFPDGADTDSNCDDFRVQTGSSLAADSAAGANNIKVAGTADFAAGQTIIIDAGANRETAVIAEVGTAGATTLRTGADAGATVIPVAGAVGFNTGQTITIGHGANRETAVVASISRGRPRGGGADAAITVAAPLQFAHAAGTQVSGTGITLTAALAKAHAGGAQIAGGLPTPGAPNQYSRVSPF
jgi:non-reducing end alpha-L-arabinofuranosidase